MHIYLHVVIKIQREQDTFYLAYFNHFINFCQTVTIKILKLIKHIDISHISIFPHSHFGMRINVVLFYSISSHSVIFHSTPLYSIPFHSMWFQSIYDHISTTTVRKLTSCLITMIPYLIGGGAGFPVLVIEPRTLKLSYIPNIFIILFYF